MMTGHDVMIILYWKLWGTVMMMDVNINEHGVDGMS